MEATLEKLNQHLINPKRICDGIVCAHQLVCLDEVSGDGAGFPVPGAARRRGCLLTTPGFVNTAIFRSCL